MPKPKVVELLLARRLAADYKEAAALIRRGLVWVDGQRLDKPGTPVGPQVSILIKRSSHDYASRGGLKLESALDALGVVVKDRVCLDLGASTGGFTDCLLRRGARRVYAFDVGKGLLDWQLRQDPRVRVREGVNVRYPDPCDGGSSPVGDHRRFFYLPETGPAGAKGLRRLGSGGALQATVRSRKEASASRRGDSRSLLAPTNFGSLPSGL